MTVSYQYDVASSTSGGFTRLLFKWKGSLYKLIYKELFIFCLAFAGMSCVYRFVFSEPQKRLFEKVAMYCDTYMSYIPLSFILGFYVSFVASRWWQQYMAIPWPDKIIHAIALHVTGYDEKGRMMRRTLARYINLSLVLILRSISSPLKKRFPTLDHLVEAGFMTSTELGIYKMVPNKEFNTYWVPCTWFTALLRDIKAQKRIPDPLGVKHIMEEFNEFRQKCGLLWSYDWVSIPLVYTQVVTIATYAFFIAAIVGRQFFEESKVSHKKKVDLFIPFFTILQFFFYMGLLKVAEQLINPFGDDDEDFELNWIIDRHMKVSYLIVDTLLLRTPPLVKDIFYDDESPVLPYTEASAEFKKRTYRGSVANMIVPEEKQNLILPDILEEGEEDIGPYTPLASLQPSVRSSAANLGGWWKRLANKSFSLSLELPSGAEGGGGDVSGLRGGASLSAPADWRRNHPLTLTVPSGAQEEGRAGVGGGEGGRGLSIEEGGAEGATREPGTVKDQRSLSVPDEGLPGICGAPAKGSSSPYCTRRDSAKSSAPLSRSSSRRFVPSGIKGSSSIGGVLVAAGVHQGFLAADPERVSLASAQIQAATGGGSSAATPSSTTPTSDDPEDRFSSSWGRAGSVIIDVGSDGDAAPRSASSRLAASLKARLAVRRRPVVKWRPYPRPPAPAPPAVALPEVLLEEVRAGLSEGEELPPGMFEDECAFMWRTIEEDGEPPPTPTLPWETPPEAPPPSPPRPARPPRTPRTGLPRHGDHLEVPRPRVLVRRPSASNRGRRPHQRRMRCLTCSLPMLAPRARPRPVPPRLTRTLSCPAIITRPPATPRQRATPTRADSLAAAPMWPRQDSR
ncbi:bestrophin-2-like isoform X3 [Portunus trituberculatus]|uniref:bestrophin-2-like isoform X3 n=1 Tax=Portunus trituberculatus TaxID=210409 RepID=UPI001E1CEB2F|nr:bestrophin-2-like isoform X3 [Portunus trituberculatus]